MARAKAKEVAELINSDTQALQNDRVLEYIEGCGGEECSGQKVLGKDVIERRLGCADALLAPCHASSSSGPFAIGTYGPTLVDVCLLPLLYNARRFGVDRTSYPTLMKVGEASRDPPSGSLVPLRNRNRITSCTVKQI